MPQVINIQSYNINDAAGEIIGVLEDTSKQNVSYFGGWLGFRASATIKVVAQRLKSSKSKFDKVIHVDCSVWKNRRVLQKAVAQEVKLPLSVMAIFNQHDEDDDFNGVDLGSRGVIADITEEIFRKLVNIRFVVIFHNGSREYIDLFECGVPVTAFLSNKVLWTWHVRLRIDVQLEDAEHEKMQSHTDVYFHTYIRHDDGQLLDLIREDAEEIAQSTGIPEPHYMNQKIVSQCFMYEWALRLSGISSLEVHAPNYWVCDGIIQGQGNTTAWENGDSLHRNMRFDWDGNKTISTLSIYELECLKFHMRKFYDDVTESRWGFATHADLMKDYIDGLPPETTSFYLHSDGLPVEIIPELPVSMFLHSSSQLRVLHLSWCNFSFASPPFLSCSQLRLLFLDHCTNIIDKGYQRKNENISCFQKLWILDLRYTDWYWLLSEERMSLMADLRELNVEGVKNWSISDLYVGGSSLVKLRVIAHSVPADDDKEYNQAPFPNLSTASHLKTVMLDNCVGLESVVPDVLPPSLESFNFVSNDASTAKISSISFRGCSQLQSIILRGCLGRLEELDLSGTAVKTLDLREVEAPNLKRLVLLGCHRLCAILWPPKGRRTESFEVVRIDTTQSPSYARADWEENTKEATAAAKKSGISRAASFKFNRHICVRDARLLRSLVPIRGDTGYVNTEVDSSPISRVDVGSSEVAHGIVLRQPDQYLYARDVVFQGHLQAVLAKKGVISWMWDCPPYPTPRAKDWYVHIQPEHEMKSGLVQQQQARIKGTGTSVALHPPSSICQYTRMLHVHDSLSITSIPFPQGSTWSCLEWCRVERCPKLHSVVVTPQESSGRKIYRQHLETFWASQLPMARYIWNWSAIPQPGGRSFRYLVFLHLDYCPRLIHVLPLSENMDTLPRLKTLEIVCCGDLREVFPLDLRRQEQQRTVKFPRLRNIHLHQLPTLQHICGSRMSAPNLEVIKIRGCWSLKRLPAIPGSNKPPKVDCEKEWWESLEWDGMEASHHPSLYEPSHSIYYKKAQLSRGTLLR